MTKSTTAKGGGRAKKVTASTSHTPSETKVPHLPPSQRLIGHSTAVRDLALALVEDKLPSTLIFQGIKGIGKSLIATLLAQTMLCENADFVRSHTQAGSLKSACCETCPGCLLFASRTHPDFHEVDCGDLKTQDLRELLLALQMTSFRAGKRVVILDHAEEMSIQCANILLKILEEPRPNTYFILIVSSASKLPATVLSRGVRLSFAGLSDAEIEQLAAKQALPEDTPIAKLIRLSSGSAAVFNELANNVAAINTSEDIFRSMLRADYGAITILVQKIAKDKESHNALFIALRSALRSGLRRETRTPRLRGYAYLLTALGGAERLLRERNLNAQYVLNAVFSMCAPLLAEASFTEQEADDTLALFQRT